jgi:uncharacterized protein with HXXEE motif
VTRFVERPARLLDTDRTHGRWPWVAAAAAPLATAALLRRRLGRAEWALRACLPALFWHQTEEWVWPGGFLPFFNREVLGGRGDEFPITRRDGFAINCVLGWGLAVAAGSAGMRAPELGAAQCGTHVANGVLHVVVSARRRRYTPGLATGLALLLPLGSAGIVAIARHPAGGVRRAAVGAALGLASGVASFLALRLRAASRR